jgi:tetratricopeptide (TPR) repeat protein
MFCTNCGEKIDDGAKFCIKCGTAVNSAFPQTAPITPTDNSAAVNKKGKSKTKYWKIFGGIALIVFLFWLCSVPDSGTQSTATAQNNVLEVNLGELVTETENNEARANQRFSGKTLRLTGFAYDISENYLFLAVRIGEYGYPEGGIFVYFNSSSEMRKLTNLDKGQRITVRGVYDGSIIPSLVRAVIENESQSQTRQPTSSATPNDAKGYFDRAVEYDEKGNYDQAIADFTSAIRIDPNYAEAYVGRGAEYADKGNYDQAIADFNQAIRLNPNFANAYACRGWTYDKKGNYDQAIADYTQAIRLNPNFADAYSGRGWTYVQKGNYDQAIADYNQAIRLDPNFAQAYNNRGLAYENKGNFTQARADVNKALQIDPNDQDAITLSEELRKKGY